MRIVFSSLAAHGHTYPLIPLARAAYERGDDVLFATSDTFHETLRAQRFRTANVGMSMAEGFLAAYGGRFNPADLGQEGMRELVPRVFGAEFPRRFAADLAPVLDEFAPDLVVYEAGNLGAGMAANRAGIPALCHGFGRPAGESAEFASALRECLAELDLDPPDGDLRSLGNPYLDIYPLSMQEQELVPTNRVPIRPIPFADHGDVPDRVLDRDPDRRLVYLTFGTAFASTSALREAISGLSTLDVDVLVAAGPAVDIAELGSVPSNVSVHTWLPQADLLGSVDLVVQHGGSGTTLAALSAGLPQVLVPQGADQFTNAMAVSDAGAGQQLVAQDFDAENVAFAANSVLADPGYRSSARRISGEIAEMPHPADIALRFGEFARRE